MTCNGCLYSWMGCAGTHECAKRWHQHVALRPVRPVHCMLSVFFVSLGALLRDRLHDNLAATSEALMDGALATGERIIERGEQMRAKVSMTADVHKWDEVACGMWHVACGMWPVGWGMCHVCHVSCVIRHTIPGLRTRRSLRQCHSRPFLRAHRCTCCET